MHSFNLSDVSFFTFTVTMKSCQFQITLWL